MLIFVGLVYKGLPGEHQEKKVKNRFSKRIELTRHHFCSRHN